MNDKKLNIRKIAELAGVSVASVSRALQSKRSPYISEKRRKQIIEICAKMHYHPNEHTRRMLSNRANTIAIFFPPFEQINADFLHHRMDPNFGACLMGAQSALAKHGIGLLLVETSDSFIAEKKYLKICRSKIVDGILLWGCLEHDQYPHELIEEQIPLVMLQNEISDCKCNTVIADDYAGMLRVTEQLLQAGHRRIAIVKSPEYASTGRYRNEGILSILEKREINSAYQISGTAYGYEFGRSAAERILRDAADVTGIIASSDMTAWGCIDELKEQGIRVPKDMSVTGADGLKIPGAIRISSFYLPSYEIGETGVELLIRQLNGDTTVERRVLPVTPVYGNTVVKYKRH